MCCGPQSVLLTHSWRAIRSTTPRTRSCRKRCCRRCGNFFCQLFDERVARNIPCDITTPRIHTQGVGRDIVITDHENVRHLLQFRGSNTLTKRITRIDDIDANTAGLESLGDGTSVIFMGCLDGQHAHLQR